MNPMYDEVEGYKPGFWKTIAVHNTEMIKGFFGPYRWLSNFHESPVWFEGLKYRSSENAYQAAKVEVAYREQFTAISPRVSKTLWLDLPKAYSAQQGSKSSTWSWPKCCAPNFLTGSRSTQARTQPIFISF